MDRQSESETTGRLKSQSMASDAKATPRLRIQIANTAMATRRKNGERKNGRSLLRIMFSESLLNTRPDRAGGWVTF
jgi:hypothetical protein